MSIAREQRGASTAMCARVHSINVLLLHTILEIYQASYQGLQFIVKIGIGLQYNLMFHTRFGRRKKVRGGEIYHTLSAGCKYPKWHHRCMFTFLHLLQKDKNNLGRE